MKRLIAATLFALVTLTGCGSGSNSSGSSSGQPSKTPTTKTAPSTLTVQGAAFLTGNDATVNKLASCILNSDNPVACRTKVGWRCEGTRSNESVHTGAQVTVSDSTGKAVGLGSLKPGVITKSTSLMHEKIICAFRFKVNDVPVAGGPIYSLKIGDKEPLNFKESDADALVVLLDEGRIVGAG